MLGCLADRAYCHSEFQQLISLILKTHPTYYMKYVHQYDISKLMERFGRNRRNKSKSVTFTFLTIDIVKDI